MEALGLGFYFCSLIHKNFVRHGILKGDYMHIQPCDIIEIRRILSVQSSDDLRHFCPSDTRIWRGCPLRGEEGDRSKYK